MHLDNTLRVLSLLFFIISLSSCDKEKGKESTVQKKAEYTKFNGSYNSLNDLQELHISAAQKNGIEPMQNRSDTLKYANRLVRLPNELDLYKIDKLTHSVPFLVDEAAQLVVQIGINFRDSLLLKKLPAYKLIITSVTRSQDDVARLAKSNTNASHNSVHCYATTFDISWKRFIKKGLDATPNVSPDRLKLVLAEVLHDLRQRNKCYVLYEKQQACFHITVR